MTEVALVRDDPMVHVGAVWCGDDHEGRGPGWECSHNSKRTKARCHKLAIRGTDSCDQHAGVSRAQAKAEGEARLTLLAAAAALGPVHPAETLLEANRIATIVMRRAAELVEAGDLQPAQLDVLGEWMDRAQRIAKATADADAADRWVRAQESVASRDADRVQELLAGVLGRLGHDWDDPAVRAAVTAALDDLGEGGK